MRDSKECVECGGIYFRGEKVPDASWEGRKYCSVKCSGVAMARAARAKKAEKKVAQQPTLVEEAIKESPADVVPLLGLILPLDPIAAQRVRPELHKREPVMRELKIVRVGPNPRLLLCEYYELATRRTCTVFVKRTTKFVRGMKLKVAEPVEELAYRRPWVYSGPAPKHRGRW